MEESKTLLQILEDGGPLMIPLLVCSVLAMGVLFDRAWAFFRNSRYDVRSLRARLLELVREDRIEEAAHLCASTPGPVAAVLLAGLQSYAKHRDLAERPESLTAVMEKAMDDYALHAMSAVEKRLSVLATVASAAPLLGFTGTVTGMIDAFAWMKRAGVESEAVAGGISEALVTTATGLIIALVAVIPYNVFTSMADKINLQIEESSSELLDFVATKAKGRA